jgi:hypothetical protein
LLPLAGGVSSGRRRPRLHWPAIGSLLAVASLVAALVFNGLGVRDSARQQRASARQESQARAATQLQLLTQLNAVVNDADLQIVGVLNRSNKPHVGLSDHERALLDHALGDFDYVAWLFENGYLTLEPAKRYWANSIRCARDTALLLERRAYVNLNFRSLSSYPGSCRS